MTSLTWAFNFKHVINSDQSIWTSLYNQFFNIHSAVCRCFPHTDLPSAPPALIFMTIICGYTSTALVNTDSQAVLKRKDPLCPWPGFAFSSEQSRVPCSRAAGRLICSLAGADRSWWCCYESAPASVFQSGTQRDSPSAAANLSAAQNRTWMETSVLSVS